MKLTKKNYDIQRNLSELFNKQPKLREIVNALIAHGGRVLLVGGAVRDILLGKLYHDNDIEVYNLSTIQLEALLGSFGIVMLVGKSFGVFRVAGLDVDFSLPRTDSSGRKPEVAVNPHLSFEDAFRRRDLTINAMGIDMQTGELIDPFNGVSDLERKKLRAPDPTLFVQDPLRFFRVMHFIGRFEFEPDEALNELCKSMDLFHLRQGSGGQAGVSAERIEDEIEKLLLRSVRPSLGFRWLQKIGRLEDIFPELYATIGVAQRAQYHPEGDVFEHSMQALDAAVHWQQGTQQEQLTVRYGALCHDLGKVSTTRLIDGVYRALGHATAGVKPARALLKRITRKTDCIEATEKLVRYHMEPLLFVANEAGDAAYKRLALKLAPLVTMEQLAAVSQADHQGRNGQGSEPLMEAVPAVESFLEKVRTLGVLKNPEKALLQGRDIAHLVSPGPAMGVMLKKAYELQLEEGITDKDELLKRL